MINLKYFDSIRMLLRSGKTDDPYTNITEQIKIVNNQVSLNEIPDSFSHVQIDNYVEVYKDNFDDIAQLASNQFYVDYGNGTLHFNSSEEGKTLTAIYKGRGVIQIPAERIWVHSPNPWAVDNLQQLIDFIYQKEQELKDTVSDGISKINTAVSNFTTFITEKYNDFVTILTNKYNEFVTKADEKINEMDTHIGMCENEIKSSQDQTAKCKDATDNAITATTDLTKIKTDCVKATSDSVIATTNCVDATNKAIDETTQMHTDRFNTRLIYQKPVNNYADIVPTYSAPEIGWRVETLDDGNIYRFDGSNWLFIGNSVSGVEVVSDKINGLMTPAMLSKLNGIEDEAQRNLTGEDAKNVLPDYFKRKIMVFVIADKEPKLGEQNVILQFPYKGILKNVTGMCNLAGTEYTEINIQKCSKEDYENNTDSWEYVLQPSQSVMFQYGKKITDVPIIVDNAVNEGDYFRLKIVHLGSGIRNITVNLEIQI